MGPDIARGQRESGAYASEYIYKKARMRCVVLYYTVQYSAVLWPTRVVDEWSTTTRRVLPVSHQHAHRGSSLPWNHTKYFVLLSLSVPPNPVPHQRPARVNKQLNTHISSSHSFHSTDRRQRASCCPKPTKPTVGYILPIKVASNTALKRTTCLVPAAPQLEGVRGPVYSGVHE